MFGAIRLAKLGYFNGNPSNILNANVDIVMQVLMYENEEARYNETYRAMNEQ